MTSGMRPSGGKGANRSLRRYVNLTDKWLMLMMMLMLLLSGCRRWLRLDAMRPWHVDCSASCWYCSCSSSSTSSLRHRSSYFPRYSDWRYTVGKLETSLRHTHTHSLARSFIHSVVALIRTLLQHIVKQYTVEIQTINVKTLKHTRRVIRTTKY